MHLKAEGYLEKIKREAEMQSRITSVGVHNAMSKKKVKLFKEDETKEISNNQKQEELDYLKETFGIEKAP